MERKETSLAPLSAYLLQELIARLPREYMALETILHRLLLAVDGGSLALELSNKELERLRSCELVSLEDVAGERATPLVLSGRYLYLRRFWNLEERVVDLMKNELIMRSSATAFEVREPEALLHAWQASDSSVNEAIALAGARILASDFLLLSGGPGSGKTFSLVRLLKLLDLWAGHAGKRLSLLVSAPTAKAVARIQEGMHKEAKFSHFDLMLSTLHRALGYRSDGTFTHGRAYPLSVDVVIVDEMSMVDIYLFEQLLSALPRRCKVIFLGDADQLPSVARGAILSDLVYYHQHPQEIPTGKHDPLAKNMLFLKGSQRSNVAILGLAQAFLRGDKAEVEKIRSEVRAHQSESLFFHALPTDASKFYDWVKEQYAMYIPKTARLGAYDATFGLNARQIEIAKAFFAMYDMFAVITPVHDGAYGVKSINLEVRKRLGFLDSLYDGMPIVITVNQPELGLANGDRGVILKLDGTYYALFREGESTYRCYLSTELGAYEVAYAITVHKSQGSEYENVAVLLPSNAKRLLDRSLIYTAITRAKSQVRIFGGDEEIGYSLAQRQQRVSQIASKILD
ncbi:exodeoxyribonuclease V subunit alpha [Entomospira culicis]|nr:exodeoxyribonuclease V subunit alpha [Entomospira culicis]